VIPSYEFLIQFVGETYKIHELMSSYNVLLVKLWVPSFRDFFLFEILVNLYFI